MKKILLVPFAIMIVTVLVFTSCGGGNTINYDEAEEYIAQEMTVCGPVAITGFDRMAPFDPPPFIVVLGKLGEDEDFRSTNSVPGNFGIRIADELLDTIPGGAETYFKGKELCVDIYIIETPVGTIGGPVSDLAQIKFK
jgi:hypothetical protein